MEHLARISVYMNFNARQTLRYLVASQSLSWSDYLTRNRRVWETYIRYIRFFVQFFFEAEIFRAKES